MEGLKLQQPVLVGLGADDAVGFDSGWAGGAGGANTQCDVLDAAGFRFEISSTSGDSEVRLRQGARLQHEASSKGPQKSEEERLSGGRGATVRFEGAGNGVVTGGRGGWTRSVRRVGS